MLLQGHTTTRLRFEKLSDKYKAAWKPFFQHQAATRYFPPIHDIDAYTRDWIKRQTVRYDRDNMGLAALHLRDSGKFVGMCGLLNQMVDGQSEIEVGYHLLPVFWGYGYATEAARYCKNFAFENDLAAYLISLIHPGNIPSQNVARRNGMTLWKYASHRGLPCLVFRIDK